MVCDLVLQALDGAFLRSLPARPGLFGQPTSLRVAGFPRDDVRCGRCCGVLSMPTAEAPMPKSPKPRIRFISCTWAPWPERGRQGLLGFQGIKKPSRQPGPGSTIFRNDVEDGIHPKAPSGPVAGGPVAVAGYGGTQAFVDDVPLQRPHRPLHWRWQGLLPGQRAAGFPAGHELLRVQQCAGRDPHVHRIRHCRRTRSGIRRGGPRGIRNPDTPLRACHFRWAGESSAEAVERPLGRPAGLPHLDSHTVDLRVPRV